MSLRKQFDVIQVKKWEAPKPGDDPVKFLSMPNIPRPLHTMAPRTVLGQSTWNFMRKKCYYDAGYKCEVCGKDLSENPYDKQAHEVYDIDYEKHTSTFVRCVCLCKQHHTEPGVHTGRALTMLRQHNVLMPKEKILAGTEDIFRQVCSYNTTRRPKGEPELRLFHVFLSYAEHPEIKEEIRKLIKKYQIKFYMPYEPEEKHWGEWKLIVGNKSYDSPFSDRDDWEKKMEETTAQSPKPGRTKTEEEVELDKAFEEIEKQMAE